jgi:hypothetical protein
MNWAKGRGTRGRGTSFKGALQYVLHDKGAATSSRVGFIDIRNLATDDADAAWREMMALCDAADDLKQRAGGKMTGRKMTKPVYAFTLNWHEADRPDAMHMQETALSALRALGMENLQAVIVEHTDRPHRHVHIIVNLIDPDTGKAVSLSNDGHKLDRWADDYEVAQGVIRSPDRRAKFHALDNGHPPPKRPAQAVSREEWVATRALINERAHQVAAELRAAYAARAAAIKEQQRHAFDDRRAEASRLWERYRGEGKAIRDRYQPFIDAVWKSSRKAPPHPYARQAVRDMQESAAWKELGRMQWRERRQFDARETSLLGTIANAVRLHSSQLGRPGITGLFQLLVSGNERRRQFQLLQDRDKNIQRQHQAQTRRHRADTLKASRSVELARLSEETRNARQIMVARHAVATSLERMEWTRLKTERDLAWAEYRKAFTVQEQPLKPQARTVQAKEDFRAVAAADRTLQNEPQKQGRADKTAASGETTRASRRLSGLPA